MDNQKTGFSFDPTDFQRGMRELVEKHTPEDIDRGIYVAANALLRDSINEVKRAPFREGHLRGSARVQTADGIMRPMTGTVSARFRTQTEEHLHAIVAGFNIEYAARWHEIEPDEEATISWTLPGSGRKFMESKMSSNGSMYLAIMAEFLRRRLGG